MPSGAHPCQHGAMSEHASAPRRALVTGASSGIGEATARELAARGWQLVITARRADRLARVAADTGATVIPADLTDATAVAALAEEVAAGGTLQALVHVAGGALGVDSVEHGAADDWQWMYNANILSTKLLLERFLPQLRAGIADDGHGFRHADIVAVTSTAAFVRYEGGAGYHIAKAGEEAILGVLRLELAGEPIRVIEVAPGLVHTEEFSKLRLRGDAEAAERIYRDVDHPLTAHDVALVIAGSLALPGHVNLDQVQVRPIAQAAHYKLHRGPLTVREPGQQ